MMYSGCFITAPIEAETGFVLSLKAFFLIPLIKSLRALSLKALYISDQKGFVMVNPASFSPCSMFTKYLEFTSPDPVPPFTVSLTPLPAAKMLHGPSSGNAPFFFSSTVHSAR